MVFGSFLGSPVVLEYKFELPTQPEMGRGPNTPEWVQHIAFRVKDRAELVQFKEHLENNGVDVLGVTDHGAFHSPPSDKARRADRRPGDKRSLQRLERGGGFSKAAEELALTHGAISHKIKQLEDYLGLRLFVRLPRNVVLTKEGSTFLSEVQAGLSMLEAASLRVAARRDKRSLRVNVLPPFAGNLLVRQLPAFLHDHSDIDLEIDATPRFENNDTAGIDVFIRYGKGDWPGFEAVKLMDVELYPVCSPAFLKKHPQVKRPKGLDDVVLLRHTMEPWDPWFRAAQAQCARVPGGPLFTDARLMLDAARDGQGVALARSVLAESDVREGRLIRLFDVAAVSPFAYFAFFVPGARARREVEAFVTWLVCICQNSVQFR